MSVRILSVSIRSEHDTVAARQRARQIARLLGFDAQDQTRISTAVSEIARNAFNYAGGGQIDYSIEGAVAPQLLLIKVSDLGPGVQDLLSVLEGTYQSQTGMGLGIVGARRLMDQFQIESTPGAGTTVWLKKLLPKRVPLVRPPDVAAIAAALAREAPQDPFQELQHQNQELLRALEEIRARQAELVLLNRELEDTNRGVVALYAELDEKADHLRRADELKSKFLSNMSHEFRSPLNSILALTGLLLDRVDGDLGSEQVQQVEYVRRAAQDLLELVNDLLDLAKVEAGKIEAKPLEFTVADLFAALRGMLRPLLLNQSVALVFDDVTHIPRMFSDEGKVSQILRNFISNALKFTESGEVRVSAALEGESDLVFYVSDTGIGIAPENLDLIFQDFSQVDGPIQRRVKGTGLGLPLSKKLATLLNGEVRVKSTLGGGSTFSLKIPLRYRDPASQPPVPQTEWAPQAGKLPVLIIEDNAAMRMMYASFFGGSIFQPVHASTTREAEDLLDQIRPAAIVLDIVLRSEDTWAFLARLAGDARAQGAPILVVSSVEDKAKAYHLGARDYIVKPVERVDFITRLRALTDQPPFNRVLIIDDNESDRYLWKRKLSEESFLVSEAYNGYDGFQKACEEKPELIVLDLNMPGMSGFEVLERLKAVALTKDIPVVICTSRILTSTEQNQLTSKAAAILSKEGLDQNTIARELRRVIATSGMAAMAR
ncbi:MAG TPA: ATP-binding protein [Bryobacteraceae bacterium]|jgi:signal transduction histidine kinase/DNA-binding response OmpR family regulator|nr:ATP-binding protein [Bryobacteraceae bacterium]